MRRGRRVVPRHPLLRMTGQRSAVLLQLGQVVKGIGAAKLTGVIQTHEQIAYVGTIQSPIE